MVINKAELRGLLADVLAESKKDCHCQFTADEVQTIKDFCESFKWVRESSIKAIAGAIVVAIGSALWFAATHYLVKK